MMNDTDAEIDLTDTFELLVDRILGLEEAVESLEEKAKKERHSRHLERRASEADADSLKAQITTRGNSVADVKKLNEEISHLEFRLGTSDRKLTTFRKWLIDEANGATRPAVSPEYMHGVLEGLRLVRQKLKDVMP